MKVLYNHGRIMESIYLEIIKFETNLSTMASTETFFHNFQSFNQLHASHPQSEQSKNCI